MYKSRKIKNYNDTFEINWKKMHSSWFGMDEFSLEQDLVRLG